MKIATFLKNIFVAKYSCISCRREIPEGKFLCDECEKLMPYIHEKRCRICGRYADNPAEICSACVGSPKQFDKGLVLFSYDDVVRRIVLRLKFKHALNLLDFVIPLMEDKMKEFDEKIDLISFIPMEKSSLRIRGYNQAKEMAKMLSLRSGIALFDGIEKVKKTKKQKTLNFAKRKDNLKKAFKVNGTFTGMTILIVDDVITTGATLDEVAKEFKRCNAARVLTLSIAGTTLRNVV